MGGGEVYSDCVATEYRWSVDVCGGCGCQGIFRRRQKNIAPIINRRPPTPPPTAPPMMALLFLALGAIVLAVGGGVVGVVEVERVGLVGVYVTVAGRLTFTAVP